MKSENSNKSRLDAVLEAVDAAIVTIDQNGIIVDFNDATSRLFGYSRNEMLDSNVKMLMPEPYQREHDDYLKNHLSTGVNRIIGSGRKVSGKHKSGDVFPVHLSVAKYDDDGLTFFTGILHDLTELDEAHSVSSRLGLIVEESVNEVYTFESESLRFTSANRAAYKNLGYSKRELNKMTPVDIVCDLKADQLQSTLAPLLSGEKERVSLSTKIERSDESIYEAEVTLHLTRAFETPEMVAIVQDVTEKNRLMESMRRNQRMESIGNLTGGIAHDFNNILTVISGNLELLRDEIDQSDSRQLLDDARDSAEMGSRLTKRLLTFASRSPLSPNKINVNILINDLSEMLRRTIGSSISLEHQLADDLWESKVDISELENALVNLAINARDAMPDGGRLLVETQNCELDEQHIPGREVLRGDYVKISVTDTGHGIPDEILEVIFEPFTTTKKGGKGTGLGLSMVYGFVRQSGGSVTVYSEKNLGTTFTLYLPRSSESVVEQHQTKNVRQTAESECKTILVAEDDDKVRRLTLLRLKELGHTVYEAIDGHEALTLFQQKKNIDLVFSDVVMTEGMTGYDLALAVRDIDPEIPVLLTSGYAEDIINSEKLEESGLPLLRKPYHQSELKAELAKLFPPR